MKFKKILFSLFILPLFFVTSCTNKGNEKSVITSFYAVNEFTKELVKDTNINVSCLVNGLVEPHEYEPTAKQVTNMTNANLVILNGLDFEEFSKNLESNDKIKDKILYASKDIELIKIDSNIDPHTFVSLKEALIMVTNIKNGLINAFDEDTEIIEKNYNDYYNRLNELNNRFEKELLNLKDSTIIVGHEAFNYFGRDYNINTKPLLGLHEEEPSAKALTDIKKYIQDNNITKIYGEHFEENESIEKVAKDCNISVSYLYTCEMMNNSNLSYIECQEENLKTLIK